MQGYSNDASYCTAVLPRCRLSRMYRRRVIFFINCCPFCGKFRFQQILKFRRKYRPEHALGSGGVCAHGLLLPLQEKLFRLRPRLPSGIQQARRLLKFFVDTTSQCTTSTGPACPSAGSGGQNVGIGQRAKSQLSSRPSPPYPIPLFPFIRFAC